MMAILGRMATYSGKMVKWDDAINSPHKLADVDALKNYEGEAPVKPDDDGNYPIPTPGTTNALEA